MAKAKVKHFDLFSGIGGFALAAKRVGWETTGFCEIDPFCQKVLKKHWPDVPIYCDIKELDGETIGNVDILTGGYPCQPFSTASAGKRRGAEDDSYLWPEFNRIIRETRPAFVIAENVVGHISMGLDAVLADLEDADYTCRTFIIPACAVNAPHRRERVWVVANSNSGGKPDGTINAETPIVQTAAGQYWEPYSETLGMADGLPYRMDRLRSLGNAVVPQIPQLIFQAIEKERINE